MIELSVAGILITLIVIILLVWLLVTLIGMIR